MNILITGCAGLLGSRMASWILDNHKEAVVIGIDDFSGGYYENVDTRVHKVYPTDLSNSLGNDLDLIFSTHNFDVVYHFAAYAAEGLSPFIRKYNYQNNLISTANIVNCCVNYDIKKLVFTSSMAVYGRQDPPFKETMDRIPIDPYGVAKASCEMDIEIANEQHGLNYTIIRPHNVYGINQNIWDRYRNVLGIWMNQRLNNNPLTIFGDGSQTRAFSYIDDCLEPMWNALELGESNGEIINLGGTNETSILKACDTLIDVMGGGDKEFLEPRHEVKEAWSTYQKSVDILGYKDNTSLIDGLGAMWNWAKNQPKRKVKNMNYEITKGLYGYWK